MPPTCWKTKKVTVFNWTFDTWSNGQYPAIRGILGIRSSQFVKINLEPIIRTQYDKYIHTAWRTNNTIVTTINTVNGTDETVYMLWGWNSRFGRYKQPQG